ncbi:hypothetical protein A2U01_0038096, partial [Trifolium medium]|nr:hypothetical protein [Trifolium medium]
MTSQMNGNGCQPLRKGIQFKVTYEVQPFVRGCLRNNFILFSAGWISCVLPDNYCIDISVLWGKRLLQIYQELSSSNLASN